MRVNESGSIIMANLQGVDKEKQNVMERILSLTLEIIYLLTGEDYTMVKKTSCNGMTLSTEAHLLREWRWSPMIESPLPSLTTNNKNEQKILKITHKITELLTGEVPIRCQDVSVYFSMEEWEYLEGHKDLYKDIAMMEDQPPLTSPDGSSNRNTPERCSPPLTTSNSSHKHHDISVDDQFNEAEDHSDHVDPICCESFKDEDMIVFRIDKDISEMCKKEEIPLETSPDQQYRSPKNKGHLITADGKTEDYVYHNPRNLRKGRNCDEESFSPLMYGESLSAPLNHSVSEGGEEVFLCFECGKCFRKQSSLDRHRQLMHIWEKPYSCSECDKRFGHKISLIRHQRIHNNENTFSCQLCRRCFAQKSHLVEHERQHTGERPYVCMECGKRFAVKRTLVSHESTHTTQNQFFCLECGKCFTRRSSLLSHQRVHLPQSMI